MTSNSAQTMDIGLRDLGALIRAHRKQSNISQETLAEKASIPRGQLSLLERGHALPSPERLAGVCREAGVPEEYWRPYSTEEGRLMIRFEVLLAELVGRHRTLVGQPASVTDPAKRMIQSLFSDNLQPDHAYDLFCSILVFYGVRKISWEFYKRFMGSEGLASLDSFRRVVVEYQKQAMRMFRSFQEAFEKLSRSTNLDADLSPIERQSTDKYSIRSEWNAIERIPSERLPDLGYIAAERVRQESVDRQIISSFLSELAERLEGNPTASLDDYSRAKRRKMDSLLRSLGSKLDHTLFSPLFSPDPEVLRQESLRLAPKKEEELARIAETQGIAQRNLSAYLTSDHLDVYIATSMRSDADFVSVNEFVSRLFAHESLRLLRLRYFNPTQSWISDRVAKGLVEALMLKRTSFTIYMAQKTDTFGKDSEASVSLGQGKPVLVYVPKLVIPESGIDSDELNRKDRKALLKLARSDGIPEADESDEMDKEALLALLLTSRLRKTDAAAMSRAVKRCWADFDLESESARIKSDVSRKAYRAWIGSVVKSSGEPQPLPEILREEVVGVLVASAVRYERRARIFREVHPLALQVILSSGILNGILVVRSIDECACLLRRLIENDLDLALVADDLNYRLVEQRTGSTIRVISRHELLENAFLSGFGEAQRVTQSGS